MRGQTTSGSFGLFAINAKNCYGSSGGSSSFGEGLHAEVAESCTGKSGVGIGLEAKHSATGCYGETAGNFAALYTLVVRNCVGKNTGSSFGLQAVDSATNCFGTSNTGTGLRTPTATSCFGQTSAGAANAALFALTATSCRGWQTGNTGVAIQADVAITCSSQAGSIVAPYKNLGTP